MTDKNFRDILDDCLERLMVKGETIEDCLSAYPQQTDELKPLLQTALDTRKVATIEPSPEFRARARYQFHTALQETVSRKSGLFSFWRLRWATVLTTVLVMLLASGGTVAAAGTSMPDSPLYPIKLAVEQWQIRLTFSDLGKANLYAQFADRRIMEIIYIAQKGDAALTEEVTQRLDNQLAMVATLASDKEKFSRFLTAEAGQLSPTETETQIVSLPAPIVPLDVTTDAGLSNIYTEDSEMSELARLLQQDAAENSDALHNALATAPEAAKSALLQAIAVSEAGYENALSAISE